ncbi:MAG: MFS transporter [Anaerolineae bacterium]
MKEMRFEVPGGLRRNALFVRLWVSQFLAVAALYALSFAAVVAVAQGSLSTTQTGLVILSSMLPAFVGSLFAGVIVDRFERTQVLLFSHLVRALAGFAFWLFAGVLTDLGPLPIYVLLIISALFTQVAISAELSLLPHYVEQSQLLSANSLLQISMLAAEGLGVVALGPILAKAAGADTIGVASGCLTLGAAVLVWRLPGVRVRAREKAGDARETMRSMGEDFRLGWRTILRDRVLRVVVAQFALTSALLLMLLSMMPALAALYLGMEVADIAFLMVPGGVGFGVGAYLIARVGNRYGRLRWISGGLMTMGSAIAMTVALAQIQSSLRWPLLMGAIFAMGVALAMAIVSARTVVQERPAPALRGRVIAAQLAAASALSILPILIGGILADRVGVPPVMLLLALLALGSGAAGLRVSQG